MNIETRKIRCDINRLLCLRAQKNMNPEAIKKGMAKFSQNSPPKMMSKALKQNATNHRFECV